jgi:hypothetical protein
MRTVQLRNAEKKNRPLNSTNHRNTFVLDEVESADFCGAAGGKVHLSFPENRWSCERKYFDLTCQQARLKVISDSDCTPSKREIFRRKAGLKLKGFLLLVRKMPHQ